MASRKGSSWAVCQSEAWDAWRADSAADFDRHLRVARKARDKCSDKYERAAVAAWPLRAMIERQRLRGFDALLKDALTVAENVEQPTGKVDALFLIWQAVFPCQVHRNRVLQKLVSACVSAENRKAQGILREAAQMIGGYDRKAATAILEAMDEGRLKRSLARRLEASEFLTPRPFFWSR